MIALNTRKPRQQDWLGRLSSWLALNRRILTWFCYGLVFCSFLYVSYFTLDPDFGWHLRSGQTIITNQQITYFDPYTYTARGFAWINHEWLHDVVIGALFSLYGYLGLAIVFAGLWTLAIRLASRRNDLMVIVIAAISLLLFAGIRPVIWTVLGLTILERLIDKPKLIRFIPWLFLIWANLHGGFILGLIILALHQLFGRRPSDQPPKLILVITLSCLATLVNPYSYQIYTEIIRTVFDVSLHRQIDEWQPLYLAPPKIFLYLVLLAGFLIVESKSSAKKLVSIPGMLLIMSLISMRHWPLFIVGSLRYLEDYWATIYNRLHKIKLDQTRQYILVGIASGVIMLLVLVGYSYRQSPHSTSSYPAKAIQYLQSQPCPGNIFNSYNYGGYLIWRLPTTKIYIDGRMPSWKHRETKYFDDYQRFYRDPGWRQAEVSRFSIKCLLVETASLSDAKPNLPINQFSQRKLEAEGWRVIELASTNKYSLLIR